MSEYNEFYNPEVIGQLSAVGLQVHRFMEGPISGTHRSPLHGVSPEFADYRSYSPGDDLRNLDWRVYARSDRFYIKRYEEESNLRAHIILDASESMSYGKKGNTKWHFAATLAVSLAATLAKQRDAIGLTTFDSGSTQHLRPSASDAHIRQTCEVLGNLQPGGETELGSVLAQVADQIQRRSLVILISDLFTDLDSFYDALGKVQFGGHEMILFHVLDRDEFELPFRGPTIFKDMEGLEEVYAEPNGFRKAYQAAMNEFMQQIKHRCEYCGIDYLTLFTDADMGDTVSHFLQRRNQGGPRRHLGRMKSLGS